MGWRLKELGKVGNGKTRFQLSRKRVLSNECFIPFYISLLWGIVISTPFIHQAAGIHIKPKLVIAAGEPSCYGNYLCVRHARGEAAIRIKPEKIAWGRASCNRIKKGRWIPVNVYISIHSIRDACATLIFNSDTYFKSLVGFRCDRIYGYICNNKIWFISAVRGGEIPFNKVSIDRKAPIRLEQSGRPIVVVHPCEVAEVIAFQPLRKRIPVGCLTAGPGGACHICIFKAPFRDHYRFDTYQSICVPVPFRGCV